MVRKQIQRCASQTRACPMQCAPAREFSRSVPVRAVSRGADRDGAQVVTIERALELSRAAHETVDATGPADNVRFAVGTARGATFPQRHVTPSKSRIAGQTHARVGGKK